MQTLDDKSPKTRGDWVYVMLTVVDGSRQLKPDSVAYDRLTFSEPPRLVGPRVEVVVQNGDVEQRHLVELLPHDAEATQIPVKLLS